MSSDQCGSEEVSSDYTYPPEYLGPRPIREQIEAIAEKFNLNPAGALGYIKNLPELPAGAEGWFAIPSVDALAAKHFPDVADPAEKYCRAVQLVLEKIAASRPFRNYREGQISSFHLRLHSYSACALDLIADIQKRDILIIACQLGLRYCHQAVRQARKKFATNEFGLGSVAVGSIALVHPERLSHSGKLDMDCAGDGFTPLALNFAGALLDGATTFSFGAGMTWFHARQIDYPIPSAAPVSAFLPQVP